MSVLHHKLMQAKQDASNMPLSEIMESISCYLTIGGVDVLDGTDYIIAYDDREAYKMTAESIEPIDRESLEIDKPVDWSKFNNNLDLALFESKYVMSENVEQVKSQVDSIARSLNVPATIIGGSALHKYNYDRMTGDIDIITSVDDAHKLGNQLMNTGKFEFIGLKKFRHIQTGLIINFCPEGTPVGKHTFPPVSHRRPGLYYADLQLLLQMKILANRSKDKGDVAELIKRNKLSVEYIEEIASGLPKFYQIVAMNLWYEAQKEMT